METSEPSTEPSEIFVSSGEDRLGRFRRVFGTLPISVKVTTGDSSGALLVIEQRNDLPGGPPRHLHHAQDEWFYVVAGAYRIEVAGHSHELGPGDALLAPRGVPHGWIFVGPEPGQMVVAFSPAGAMEAFFDHATELPTLPPHPEVAALFAAHGMKVTGPPLELS